MRLHSIVIASLFLFALAGCSRPAEEASPKTESAPANPTQPVPAQQASGKLEVSPSEVKAGQKTTLRFTLADSKGQPVTDATVRATLTMPMGKSEMKDQVVLKWDGTAYTGSLTPSMAGTWDVKVNASRDGKLVLSLPSQIEAK